VLPKTDPKNVPIAMEWVRDPAPLSREAGMHRSFGIALCAAERRAPIVLWTVGSMGAAGKYTVIHGEREKFVARLTVKMDPRIGAPEDALRGNFWRLRAFGAAGEMAAARERAEELQKEIAARKAAAVRTQRCGGLAELRESQ